MLSEMVDLSEFLLWLFENYPESKNEYFKNPDIIDRFIYDFVGDGIENVKKSKGLAN